MIVKSHFVLRKYDVFLIEEVGGSECASYYRFLTIKSEKKYSVSDSYGNCASPIIYMKHNRIKLSFPRSTMEVEKERGPIDVIYSGIDAKITVKRRTHNRPNKAF